MKFKLPILLSLIIFMSGCYKTKKWNYPLTEKIETADTIFGKTVQDPYRWLEDAESDQTKNWVKTQNDFTNGYLQKIPFRQKINERLSEIYNYTKVSTPIVKSGKYFFFKTDGLQNQGVLYYRDSIDGTDKVILDPNQLSEDGTIAIGEFDISKNGEFVAYSLASGGSDWREIYIKNLSTGEQLSDKISRVKFSNIQWYKDGFYYSCYPEIKKTTGLKFHKIFYHKAGTDQIEDELIYENNESPDRILSADVTEDERFLIITESESTYGNKLLVKDLTVNKSKIVALSSTFLYENFVAGNIGNKFFIRTNELAPRFKLQGITFNEGGGIIKEDLIPETTDILDFISLANNKIFAKYLIDAHSIVKIYDLNGQYLYPLDLPGLVDLSEFKGIYGEVEAFYTIESYISPPVTFRYDVEKNSSEVFYKAEVQFNPDDFITELKFYISKDGTRVPIYLTHKKDIELNGNNHTLLYGYGGFNQSLGPRFIPNMILWLESGGIFANANIRGGGEYGEEWHQAGIKLKKQNVFDDFIAAAEYLIREKYTSPDKLVIEGRSNGGLLVGAVTNQRPDLFKVALPGVGVMDMLRFSKFTIGWAWESDYGSVKDSAEFENLLTISPLHNIAENSNYPAVFVTTANRDDRVVPAHSYKYIATLQEKCRGKNPVLIRIQTEAGHGAGKPTKYLIDERTDILAFTYFNLNINPFKE